MNNFYYTMQQHMLNICQIYLKYMQENYLCKYFANIL